MLMLIRMKNRENTCPYCLPELYRHQSRCLLQEISLNSSNFHEFWWQDCWHDQLLLVCRTQLLQPIFYCYHNFTNKTLITQSYRMVNVARKIQFQNLRTTAYLFPLPAIPWISSDVHSETHASDHSQPEEL